jgi:nucleoside-diphosphate-sugar epimerase
VDACRPAGSVTLIYPSIALARKGIGSVVGPGDAYWPALWVDDAAEPMLSAMVAAPAGVYDDDDDVVDNRPLTRAELHRAMADAVGHRLRGLPRALQRLLAEQLASSLSRSLRVSNRRFAGATGWRPTVPDAIAGWRRITRPILIGC